MPLETIEFNGKHYPLLQSEGNAARWIMPLAQYYCKGEGVDIGAHTKAWAFPGAAVVDPIFDGQHAMSFAADNLDYIFSSHCLEHVKENWYSVLDYWLTKLKEGGILFLYLPHKSQEYWLPKNNRKHVHSFDGSEITEYLHSLGHKVFCSGVDYNNAFVVVCEKKWEAPKLPAQRIDGEKTKQPMQAIEAIGKPFLMTDKSMSVSISKIQAELISDDTIWYNGKAYHA